MNWIQQRMFRLFTIMIACGLFAITLGLYFQTWRFEFINLDDPRYVYENSTFTQGITQTAFYECLTKNAVGNWHPLTMLSYGADVWLAQQLGWWKVGCLQSQTSSAGGIFHLHNALLHAFNTVLLFIFLLLLIRGPRYRVNFPSCKPSTLIMIGATATAFWAWHPLRAESVAWVASRKDVVCVFWFLLGHIIYLNEVLYRASLKTPVRDRRYVVGIVLACVSYILSFMGKPTAVIYPFTLFLMELTFIGIRGVYRRWYLYAGLLGLTTLFCCIVLTYQEAAIGNVPAPLFMRLLNAIVAIGAYIRTTLFPSGLSLFYVYGESLHLGQLVFGFCVCSGLVWMIYPFIKQFKKDFQQGLSGTPARVGQEDNIANPKTAALFSFGASWFLITLVPVIGIVQAGAACRADRYTYLSGIGLSIVLCLMGVSVAAWTTRVWQRGVLAVSGGVCLGVLLVAGDRQIGVWKNDFCLNNHALALNSENDMAHSNLGVRLMEERRYDEAFPHLCMYGVFKKDRFLLERTLGAFLHIPKGERRHIADEEILDFSIAVDDPYALEKHWAYSMIAGMRGCYALAESEIKKALAINAQNGYLWHTLATILMVNEGYEEETLAAYRKSLTLLPKTTYLYPQISRSIQELEAKAGQTQR